MTKPLTSEGYNPITILTTVLQYDDEKKSGIASATWARFYACPSSPSFTPRPSTLLVIPPQPIARPIDLVIDDNDHLTTAVPTTMRQREREREKRREGQRVSTE